MVCSCNLPMNILTKDEFDKNTWEVIDKYYNINKGYQFVKHQIESYNDFIEHKLNQIINGFNDIEITHLYQPETDNFKYILKIRIDTPVLNNPEIYEKDGSKKTMTPNDARQRNFTYSSLLTVNMHITTYTWNEKDVKYTIENKTLYGVNLGKVPIMVKSQYCILNNKAILITSGECKYDYGGYFIINGNEKVIISQDRISENKTYVFINNKVSTYSHIAEIRSVQENKLGVPKITTLKLSAKGNQFGRYIRANIHHIKNDIPIFILFKALGLSNDKEILKYIVYDLDDSTSAFIINELVGCVEEADQIMCQKDALEYLSKYLNITGYAKEILTNKYHRLNIVKNVLEKEFLPHVGGDFYKKALYLGYMVNKLIKCFLGLKEYDNRDSYINKRVDSPGVLLANLFRQYYGKVIKDMKNMIQKEINIGGWKATNKFINVISKVNIYKIIKSTIIDSGMRYALATGNWGIKNNKNKQGVAQVLNRMTYSASISHLRRINTPIEKSGKLIQPRKLHSTQFGIICPSETPEGSSVGLVKNLAMMASITICSNSDNVRGQLEEMGCIIFNGENVHEFYKNTKVIVNGDIVGFHREPHQLFKDLKILKRKGCINIYTGIVWNILNNEICICTEGGRCVRPLYIIDEVTGNIRMPKDVSMIKHWQDLVIGTFGDLSIDDSVVEFVDVEESNSSMIAMKYGDIIKGNKGSLQSIKYTHLEIHPSLILGVLASSIPFSDRNQAPRNTYQSLELNTPVLMADNTYKLIRDVKVGDEVITFDPITKYTTVTKVINQYIKSTDNKVMEITTISGRKITATDNHHFMTNKGWQEVKDFDDDTCVAISMEQEPVSTEHTIHQVIKVNIKELEKLNLAHINSNDKRLHVIARIAGYIMSNNGFRFNVYFSTKNSSSVFVDDMKYIGFKNVKIVDKNNTYYRVTYDKIAGALFTILGICPGRKIKTSQIIPEWIMNGSLMIKREYLAGYRGGEKKVGEKKQLRFTEFTRQMNLLYDCFENPDVIGYRYDYDKIAINALDIENKKVLEFYADEHPQKKQRVDRQKITCQWLTMFVPIKSIIEVANCLISDITVESTNQSFIANNFLSHNSAQAKQAIGIYASNYKNRYDTMGHILNSPQQPLVKTKMATILNQDKMPNGMNAIVAIATYTGFNQEDSVILNQSAVDRGMFVSTYFRTYKEQNNKNHSNGEEEFFTKPEIKGVKPFNYSKLNDDGFVSENEFIQNGDIIIGKCMPNKNGSIMTYKDNSIPFKNNEMGFIDRNCVNDKYFTNTNGDGYTFAKVRVRNDRHPTIGDKLSCYTPDHEILTTKGWITFDKLTDAHCVATIVDGALVYQYPTEIQEYDHDGEIYKIDSNQVQLKVTLNHRMYVSNTRIKENRKYTMKLAEECYRKRWYYKKNVDVWEPNLSDPDIPKELVIEDGEITRFRIQNDQGEIEFPIDDWLIFYGIWVAEGCTLRDDYVTISTHKERVKKALSKVIINNNLDVRKHYDKKPDDYEGGEVAEEDRHIWIFRSDALVRYIYPLSVGSTNKALQDWVWYLSMDQCVRLIKGMCKGDGHTMKNGTVRYDTSSTILADQFQRLCLHAGLSSNKQLKEVAGSSHPGIKGKNKPIVTTVDAWRLTIIESQNEPIVNKNYVVKTDEGAVDSKEDYTGKVYCCTVPRGDGVVYVRLNGVSIWCGQSRSGQKGTCGILYRQEDMPFTKEGIVPDIIMNPHAIPSRMTIGQLIECIMGKTCAMLGTYGDATPFNEIVVEDVAEILEQCGMERYGNEILYNSRTGEQMTTDIFIGPTYYQRLKHMTADKIHSRSSNGPIVLLTRQPSDGRAREGGLRLGEMELEVLESYGALQFLKERIMECSDNYRVFVCRKCGLMAIVNPNKKIYRCNSCKNNTDFAEIRIPYCMKLLLQEVQTMSIATRFLTNA